MVLFAKSEMELFMFFFLVSRISSQRALDENADKVIVNKEKSLAAINRCFIVNLLLVTKAVHQSSGFESKFDSN